MANDLFKSFTQRVAPKREGAAPELVVDHKGERLPYEALGTRDKAFRFEVRCTNGVAHSLAYSYLTNISYDRHDYTGIFLTVSGLTVTIKGRALRPIVEALTLHACDFIQAFDAGEFSEPHDPAAPYVRSIDVEVPLRAVPTKDDIERSSA